ncbi:hypothetical protein CLOM_g1807 [Closterium sp. NIES-68]|nr:hypothetical protein CLOM_g1807 [Closterium sp. NIES-68]
MTHVEDLLAAAIKTQQFPYDPAAVYFVISDELVTQVSKGKVLLMTHVQDLLPVAFGTQQFPQDCAAL